MHRRCERWVSTVRQAGSVECITQTQVPTQEPAQATAGMAHFADIGKDPDACVSTDMEEMLENQTRTERADAATQQHTLNTFSNERQYKSVDGKNPAGTYAETKDGHVYFLDALCRVFKL